MTNLLRKCENCVFVKDYPGTLVCAPKLPNWVRDIIKPNIWLNKNVSSTDAVRCEAFRLRDVGEN